MQIQNRSIKSLRKIVFGLFILFVGQLAFGQGTKENYQSLQRQRSLGMNLVFNHQIRANWLDGRNAMWYQTTDADKTVRYQLVDIKKRTNSLLFTNMQLEKWISSAANSKPKGLTTKLKKLRLKFGKSLSDVYFSVGDRSFHFKVGSKKIRAISAAKIPKADKSQTRNVYPSESGTARASLEVVNNTNGPVEIYWVETGGAARSYGKIQSGKSYQTGTFLGHRWLVRNGKGKNVAYFSVDNSNAKFSVGEKDRVQLRADGLSGRNREFYLSGNKGYKKKVQRPRRDRSGFSRVNRTSPDGKWKVEIRKYNVFLTNTKSKKSVQLTTDGKADHYYGDRIYWSPNSQNFVALQIKPAQRHTVSFVESSPRGQVQPKLHSFNYLKPGDRVRVVRPQMFSVKKKKKLAVDNKLFANPYQISRFRWERDSSEFTFLFNQRGHQVLRLVGIDSKGKTREVVGDSPETFVHYSEKTYLNFLDQTGEILWGSERDGFNHLYLFDFKTGKLKSQVTKGKWVLRRILNVDQKKRQVWFTASGIIPGQDPYYIHYCRVDFSGKNLVVMTKGDGTHQINYSPDRKYFVDRFSRVDMAPVTELRETKTGKLVCLLEKGNMKPLVKAGWRAPERFVAKGRDGETDIYGVIYRPSHFQKGKTYPVIEYIYAGPHNSFVPKSFGPYRWEKALAELGFIVVQIDGMGTSNRGKKFHDVCWKNLGDSGFPDRIKWIKAAAKKYPEMDISKVGIFGGSAGGQSSTRALLAFGDFYKVAVSDCGCHDNRMDKIWWNEQWMGWPIGDHYKEQSNVTQAHNLKGDLFLIVGELDRNVDPASTMQVVNALVKADKDFDLLVVPGGGHGSGWTRYGKRRTADYFVRKILGKEPRN